MHLKARSIPTHPMNPSFSLVQPDGEVFDPWLSKIWKESRKIEEEPWKARADERCYFPMRSYTIPSQQETSLQLFIEFTDRGHQFVFEIINGIGQWYFEFIPTALSFFHFFKWPAITVEHGFFTPTRYLVLVDKRTYRGLSGLMNLSTNPIRDHWNLAPPLSHKHFHISIILDLDQRNDGILSMKFVSVNVCQEAKLIDLFNTLCGPGCRDDFYLSRIKSAGPGTLELGELQHSRLTARVKQWKVIEAFKITEGIDTKLFPLQSRLGQRERFGWLICYPACVGGVEQQQMLLKD